MVVPAISCQMVGEQQRVSAQAEEHRHMTRGDRQRSEPKQTLSSVASSQGVQCDCCGELDECVTASCTSGALSTSDAPEAIAVFARAFDFYAAHLTRVVASSLLRPPIVA